MANIHAYLEKGFLDWCFNGAAAPTIPKRYAALVYTPSFNSTMTANAGTEHSTNLGYSRQTITMASASSPAGSVSNLNAMTFGPFSSSAAIQGLLVTDTESIFAGNILWYGTLLTARTVLPGDTLVVSSGQLLVTIS